MRERETDGKKGDRKRQTDRQTDRVDTVRFRKRQIEPMNVCMCVRACVCVCVYMQVRT